GGAEPDGSRRRAGADLRERQAAHETCAHGEVSGAPTGEPRQRSRGRGRERVQDGGRERKAEQRGDDRAGKGIRRNGQKRNRLELKREDRRGGEPAGGRDREEAGSLGGKRVPLQHVPELGRERENRDHRREGELEARVEQRVRIPRQEDEPTEQKEPPPVAL